MPMHARCYAVCSDEAFQAYLAEASDGDHIQLYNDADRISITSEGPLYINVAALLQGGQPSAAIGGDSGSGNTSSSRLPIVTASRLAAKVGSVGRRSLAGRDLLQAAYDYRPQGLTIIDCRGHPTALIVTAAGAIISNMGFTNCSRAAVIVQTADPSNPEPVTFINSWFYDNYGAALLVTTGYARVESCTFKRNTGSAIMVKPNEATDTAVVTRIKSSLFVENAPAAR